jgi:hypothetical protein
VQSLSTHFGFHSRASFCASATRETYLQTRIAELGRIVAELRARLAELEATHRGWLKD